MKSSALLLFLITAFTNLCAQQKDFASTDFSKADSVAERYAAYPLTDIKGLADKLTRGFSSEQEKFRSIFKWVCSNIEVDYHLVLQNRMKRAKLHGNKLENWNRKFNAQVFETLLRSHKTLCTGYAYLIRELSYHAGLTCEIINGHAKPHGIGKTEMSVNHSWNRIQLNGKWYFCDATWASGAFNLAEDRFVKKYRDEYFLTDPQVFARDHLRIE